MAALAHEGSVESVAISPDGTVGVTGSADSTCRLVELESGKPLSEAIRHENFVSAVAFSRDGSMLATGDYLNARVWRLDQGVQQSGDAKTAWISSHRLTALHSGRHKVDYNFSLW